MIRNYAALIYSFNQTDWMCFNNITSSYPLCHNRAHWASVVFRYLSEKKKEVKSYLKAAKNNYEIHSPDASLGTAC